MTKQLFLFRFLLLIVFLAGCKEDETKPDLTAELAGTWQATEMWETCKIDHVWKFSKIEGNELNLAAKNSYQCDDTSEPGQIFEELSNLKLIDNRYIQFDLNFNGNLYKGSGELVPEKKLSVSMIGDVSGKYLLFEEE